MVDQKQKYSADNIQVLKGLEAVRKRPAMYIGDVTARGLHHLVYEIVDNSIDEAMAGFCSEIKVEINVENSITVTDNGRGIPVDLHKKEGKSALEVIMTVLHAGGKFDKNTYKVSGGLHGVGASVVNALSKYCQVEVFREGKIYMQEYECGKPIGPIRVIGDTKLNGTKTIFLPDPTIFKETEFYFQTLAERLRELAFLSKGLKIILIDHRENGGTKEIFHYDRGLAEFIRYKNASLP
jgi:DNA gyrase subunit B